MIEECEEACDSVAIEGNGIPFSILTSIIRHSLNARAFILILLHTLR